MALFSFHVYFLPLHFLLNTVTFSGQPFSNVDLRETDSSIVGMVRLVNKSFVKVKICHLNFTL